MEGVNAWNAIATREMQSIVGMSLRMFTFVCKYALCIFSISLHTYIHVLVLVYLHVCICM